METYQFSMFRTEVSFTHLDQRPVRLNDLDDHHHGDADHGGQGKSPAYPNGPVRILVHLVVCQWLVFDQREDKAALGRRSSAFKPKLSFQGLCF